MRATLRQILYHAHARSRSRSCQLRFARSEQRSFEAQLAPETCQPGLLPSFHFFSASLLRRRAVVIFGRPRVSNHSECSSAHVITCHQLSSISIRTNLDNFNTSDDVSNDVKTPCKLLKSRACRMSTVAACRYSGNSISSLVDHLSPDVHNTPTKI